MGVGGHTPLFSLARLYVDMALVGLFGAFVALVIAQLILALAISDSGDRPSLTPLFLMVMLESGGVGPSAWIRGLIDAVSWLL